MLSTEGEWQDNLKLALQYAQTAKIELEAKIKLALFCFLRGAFREMPNACKHIFRILKTDTRGSFFGCC